MNLLLFHKRFKWIIFSSFVSSIGDGIGLIAILSILGFEGKSPSIFGVALTLILWKIPFIILFPITGLIVDKVNAKKAMIFADLIRSLLIMLLCYHMPHLIIIILFLFITAFSTLFLSANFSLIPEIISPDLLAGSHSLSMIIGAIASIIGPILGGIVISIFGKNAALSLDSLSFLLSAFFIFRVTYHIKVKKDKANMKISKNILKKMVLILMPLIILPFFTGIFDLFIPFLFSKSKGGFFMLNFGIAFSIKGMGIFFATILLLFKPKKGIILINPAIFLALIGFLATFFFLNLYNIFICIIFFLITFLTTLFLSLYLSFIQQNMPLTMRGRLYGIFAAFSNISFIFSLIMGTFLGKRIGLEETIGGIGVILIIFAGFTLLKPAKKYFNLKQGKEHFFRVLG
ncbi:MAG: MFS transporter [Deltaproteobacteria bacterium]|nr:MFS transporter [Deltaproteobacteria bacterium]